MRFKVSDVTCYESSLLIFPCVQRWNVFTHPQRSLLTLKAVIYGWWPRLTVESSCLEGKTLWILLFGAPLSLIFIFSNATTDSRTVSRGRWRGWGAHNSSVRWTVGGCRLCWAADEWKKKSESFCPAHRLKGPVSKFHTPWRTARQFRVRGEEGRDAFPPPSTRSISPGVMARDGFFPATNPESQGAQLSLDPCRNHWARRGDRRPSRDCGKIMAWCWCLSDGISFSKSRSRVKGQSSLNGEQISDEVKYNRKQLTPRYQILYCYYFNAY